MENQRSVSLPKNIKPLYSNVHSWPYQSVSRVQIILVFKAQESVFVQDSLIFFFSVWFSFCLFVGLFYFGFGWVLFGWFVFSIFVEYEGCWILFLWDFLVLWVFVSLFYGVIYLFFYNFWRKI